MIFAVVFGSCVALMVLTYPVQWLLRWRKRRRTRLAEGRVYYL